MQYPDLGTLVLFGVPMMPLLFGLVEMVKARGVSGRALTITSAVIGIVGGVLYQFTTTGVPDSFYGWLYMGGFGLFIGLATSGAYKGVKGFVKYHAGVSSGVIDPVKGK